jgi:hypothetical protein
MAQSALRALRIATYLHARFPMLNLDNMVHNALGITINNSAHHQQFSSPGTSRSCAPRGRARRTNASRFAHASSRLRIASRHPTCSSFCSTHRSPACAGCCTTSCKQHAREPPRGPGRRISKQDGVRSRSARAAGRDRERGQGERAGARRRALPSQHVGGVRNAPPPPQNGLSEPAPHRVCHSHADIRGEARHCPRRAVEQRDRHTTSRALAKVGEEARRLRPTSGPKAPCVETVSGIKRIRGGSAPYSVLTQ